MAGDTDCCGFQMLNAVGIVTSVQEESDPVDDEDEENDESCNGSLNADVFSALEIAMEGKNGSVGQGCCRFCGSYELYAPTGTRVPRVTVSRRFHEKGGSYKKIGCLSPIQLCKQGNSTYIHEIKKMPEIGAWISGRPFISLMCSG
ncbi:hypothetical protein TNCV_2184511 [Trichonephila clavipes]|nr:hypothetical protein TNCV_2184511 [Trichonephila clavipes]